jgi:hypothetical protein
VRGTFNRYAVAFHYKPPLAADDVPKMVAQARAQARTAIQLRELHDTWRVVLATGDDPVQRTVHRALRGLGRPARLARAASRAGAGEALKGRALAAARGLASEAYFEELDRVRRA